LAHDKLAELLKTQKSLTEWLDDIQHKDAEAIRREDNDKRERLRELNKIIGLPFDRPTQFEGIDLANKSPRLKSYLAEHGEELCALRLIPKEDGLEKLRMRGKTVAGAYAWFLEQDIDPKRYRADFIPHAEHANWATIFIVNKYGVQGEIIKGGHHQLTQGFHKDNTLHVFRYDFKDWMIHPKNPEVLTHLKKLAKLLKVEDISKQDLLKTQLGATFANNYLEGYFETSDSDEFNTWFIDYSPTLGKMYADTIVKAPSSSVNSIVSGMTGSPGKAKGTVQIIHPDKIDVSFAEGSILVCEVTTPNYVPLMQKAAAILTDQGGILSHAAIVARELKKPCIVGIGNATKILKNGQQVLINANSGTVRIKK